eukprot:Tamp_09399.p1 GENE.Tamp_09399~~Tamp_09399.p1  ORF type:complete len:675 (-),score=160.12 Tamp_09399:159-2162(-)
MAHEGPGWSVHSPSASGLRGGRPGASSPATGKSSVYIGHWDRDTTAHTRQQSPLSMDDIFASHPGRAGASTDEFLGEYRPALSPGKSDDGFVRSTASRQAAASSLETEKEMQRFKKGGLTTAEERETEIMATVRDLTDRNEELVRELQRERQRTSDLTHRVDRQTKELDAERVDRKKFEREAGHKGRELAWAHSLIQELRGQISENQGRDESQQRVQAELLSLLEQQVQDGDRIVKELQESLVKSEVEIDTLRRDLAAERERRMSLDETNQALRMQAAEDERKAKILIKYKENASRQMAQQHEAVLKKLFESAEVLEREHADEFEPAGVLGTSWPVGSSPLRRTLEAAGATGTGRGVRSAHGGSRDGVSPERIVTDRKGGTSVVRKETGGMKSYTELRMEKEAAERKLRLAQRQLKLVVHEHSKLLEKHRLMSSTKDTLLEELKTVRSAANHMERDLKDQVDKVRTRSSHMEREAIFEREARARAVTECSWLRDKLSTLYEKTDHLNKRELERRNERADLLRNLKVRESEIESMMQSMQGLAQDMWLRLETEAKLMWGGLNEYRAALEQSARVGDESRIHGHEEWATVFQSVGQLLREFESGMHEKLIENASADVREAIRTKTVGALSSNNGRQTYGANNGGSIAFSEHLSAGTHSPSFYLREHEDD